MISTDLSFISSLHLIIITLYILPFFFFNWKPSPWSLSLICTTSFICSALCYLLLTLHHNSTHLLHYSASVRVLFPRRKPHLIHSASLPCHNPASPSLSHHSTLAFSSPQPCRRDVCVYHTLISADTCSTHSPLLIFSCYLHTNMHMSSHARRGMRGKCEAKCSSE